MTAQQSLDFGRALKEAGMQKSLAHANQVHPDWSERAYEQFKIWIQYRSGPFTIESFRQGTTALIETPPSLRAFGSLAVRAKREGLIKHCGYAQVENAKAHRATASLWKRV